jgi:hypothetical protein
MMNDYVMPLCQSQNSPSRSFISYQDQHNHQEKITVDHLHTPRPPSQQDADMLEEASSGRGYLAV